MVFKKEISFGNLLQICSILGAVLYAYSNLDKRVSLTEQAINYIEKKQGEDMMFIRQSLKEIQSDMKAKVDK